MQYISKLRRYKGENQAKSVLEDAWEYGGGSVRKECFIFKKWRGWCWGGGEFPYSALASGATLNRP